MAGDVYQRAPVLRGGVFIAEMRGEEEFFFYFLIVTGSGDDHDATLCVWCSAIHVGVPGCT